MRISLSLSLSQCIEMFRGSKRREGRRRGRTFLAFGGRGRRGRGRNKRYRESKLAKKSAFSSSYQWTDWMAASLPPSSQLRLKICKFEMGPPACPPTRQKQFKVEEELLRLYVLHNKQRRQVEIIICELRRRGSREVGVSRNSCPLKARHLRLWTDYSHAFP